MQPSDFFEYHFINGVLDPTPRFNYKVLVRTFLYSTGPYKDAEEFIKALAAFCRMPLDPEQVHKAIEEIVNEQQEKSP